MTQIKVCGVTTLESCRAVSEGVDLVGLNFWSGSKRFVSPADAAALVSALPPGVRRVGLFVNASAALVKEATELAQLQLLQFHGDETPAWCRQFNAPFMKAFRLQDELVIETIADYLDSADHPYLVDAFVPGARGGTGARVDLELALRARSVGTSMMLAGGLTAENVGQAIERVHPWGVDVASGVECRPGSKDRALVEAFVRAVRARDA